MEPAPLKVYLHARDLLTETGLRTQLLACPALEIEHCPSQAQIAVLACPGFDEQVGRQVSQLRSSGCDRLVLVVKTVDREDLSAFLDLQVSGLIREAEATPRRLATAARSVARGGACLPADLVQYLLGIVQEPELLRQVSRRNTSLRLDPREEAVIRLLAEGYDTYQIAEELHFSERTIKGVVHRGHQAVRTAESFACRGLRSPERPDLSPPDRSATDDGPSGGVAAVGVRGHLVMRAGIELQLLVDDR